MKRVIKFRGKSLYDKYPKANGGFEIHQGAFVYGNLVVDMNGNPQIDIQGYIDGNSFHHSLWVDANTVGQFTGLFDKNGREIYEGDIIRHSPKSDIYYIIEWRDCGLIAKQIGSSSYAGITYWRNTTEVIGNIYDNPELAKGGMK